MLKKHSTFSFPLLCVFCYFFLGHYVQREETVLLLSCYGLLFFCSWQIIGREKSIHYILFLGVLFRLLFLFSTPSLSQDFYRFIWDGNLISNGINPYIHTPTFILDNGLLEKTSFTTKLYEKMGALSASNTSNYPPINQFFFFLSSSLFPTSILGNIFVMRVFMLLSDFGIFWIGIKLLKMINIPQKRIGFYFLNPLIIIELTENLHWEGTMLFLFLLGIYFVFQMQWMRGAFFLSLSVALKIIPLLILPLFWKYLKPKKSILFGFSCLFFIVLFFLPVFLFEKTSTNYFETMMLWFSKFEFNASIYYIIREIGYSIKGYNIIQQVGKITPFVVVFIVACFSFFRKENCSKKGVLTGMLFVLSSYFFLSTTVHPWYVISLVVLSLFSQYNFPFVWSLVVFFSYSAYGNSSYQENLFLLSIEYVVVFGVLFYEVYQASKKNQKSHSISQSSDA